MTKRIVSYYTYMDKEHEQEIQSSFEEYTDFMNLSLQGSYGDEISSDENRARESLSKLLLDAKNGSIQCVLVQRIDEFSRKMDEAIAIIESLMSENVQVITLIEELNTSTEAGKVALSVIKTFASLEKRDKINRAKKSMTERARSGHFTGGSVFGYDVENKQLVINEKEAAVVKEIFELAEQGLGYKAITNKMNEAGHRSKKENPFSIATLKTILENPVYIGKVRFNQHEYWNEGRRSGKNTNPLIVDGVHEAIISLEQWERVHQLKELRSKKPSQNPYPFFLSGTLKCPKCGAGMVPASSSSSKNGRYYGCGQYHNKGSKFCRAYSVNADKAESVVLQNLKEIFATTELLSLLDASTLDNLRPENFSGWWSILDTKDQKSIVKGVYEEIQVTEESIRAKGGRHIREMKHKNYIISPSVYVENPDFQSFLTTLTSCVDSSANEK